MKRKLAALLSMVLLLVFCAVPVQAHSGRTDASGGHRDNKNASGLGYYHYHHGYGPHLHPGGVCPYEVQPVPVLVQKPAPKVTPKPVKIVLNGQETTFNPAPIIENGTTLVPMRAIFESMGATVSWDQGTQTVNAIKGDTTVVLQIGSKSPTVNGKVWPLDVPAKVVNGHTLAPARFVGEAFGGSVGWDQSTQTVTISSSGQ